MGQFTYLIKFLSNILLRIKSEVQNFDPMGGMLLQY